MANSDAKKTWNVGFYGHCGHALVAVREGKEQERVRFVGFAPSFPGETMERIEKAIQETGQTPERYDDLKTLLEQGELDILVVDNLFGQHYDAVKPAIQQGLHVFAEKPIATELEDLEELERLQQGKGVVVHGMHTLRFSPSILTMKEMIEDGAIGEIRMIGCQKSYRFGTRPEFYRDYSLYGGTIPWVAIHGIDVIQFLCGSTAKTVFARQSSKDNRGYGEMEMTALCTYEMGNQVLAHVHADFLRPANAPTHGDDRVRVVGTKGVLEYIGEELFYIGEQSDGTVPVPLAEQSSALFLDFLKAIEQKDSGALTTADSFEVTRMALKARESAETGQVVSFARN